MNTMVWKSVSFWDIISNCKPDSNWKKGLIFMGKMWNKFMWFQVQEFFYLDFKKILPCYNFLKSNIFFVLTANFFLFYSIAVCHSTSTKSWVWSIKKGDSVDRTGSQLCESSLSWIISNKWIYQWCSWSSWVHKRKIS